MAMDYDLIIRGGTVYEGDGKPGYVGDVAVKGDRIAAVGKVEGAAKREIDASGMAVSPGFIDVHSHYDGQLFWDPLLSCSSWHGVTTIVMGNCGVAFAPCKPEQRQLFNYMFSRVEGVPEYLLEQAVPWDWESYGEFMDAVQRRKPGLNVVCLMGQSAVRAYVMGDDAVTRKEATRDEIERMKQAVREGMKAGAFGLSASRMPVHLGVNGEPMPGAVASDAELIEVFDTVGEFEHAFIGFIGRQFVANHDLEKEQEEDWKLMKTIARDTGKPVSLPILHMYNSPENWSNFLKKTEDCWDQGMQFYVQTSPWISAPFDFTLERVTSLFDDMPNWRKIFKLPPEQRRARYEDPEVQKELRYDAVEYPAPRFFHRRWDLVFVKQAQLEKNKHLEGKSVAQIAEETGGDVFDIFMSLSLEEDMKMVFSTLTVNGDPDAVFRMMTHPKSLASLADGGAHLSAICQTSYPSYILSHWVRERKALSIEQAIDVLATRPAAALGLGDRGALAAGKYADITVFDPDNIGLYPMESVNDLPAGGQRMVQRGKGIRCTVVNGELLMEDNDRHSGAWPGRVLRSNAA
jgi:N-acyl-D-aspartate/D-glutamate deacylase